MLSEREAISNICKLVNGLMSLGLKGDNLTHALDKIRVGDVAPELIEKIKGGGGGILKSEITGLTE